MSKFKCPMCTDCPDNCPLDNEEDTREYSADYYKGRADAISEISREMRALYGNEYEKQIRADALEEFRKFSYCKVCEEKGWDIYCDYCRVCQAQEYIAEQLKENK